MIHATFNVMEVSLTPGQQAFIREGIAEGRFHTAEGAIQEALAMWEERERVRAEILASVDKAEASLARGQGRSITPDSMRDLSNEVKRRGRARLAAEEFDNR